VSEFWIGPWRLNISRLRDDDEINVLCVDQAGVGALPTYGLTDLFDPTHMWFEGSHWSYVAHGNEPVVAKNSHRAYASVGQANCDVRCGLVESADCHDAAHSLCQNVVGSCAGPELGS
jgi:hypothetical protein